MNAAQHRAELLAALAEVEALRDGADRTIGTLRRVLAETAVTMPPLAEPERTEWVSALEAARILGVEKKTMSQRARRGVAKGIARMVGGRWQVRIDLMAPSSRGRG